MFYPLPSLVHLVFIHKIHECPLYMHVCGTICMSLSIKYVHVLYSIQICLLLNEIYEETRGPSL